MSPVPTTVGDPIGLIAGWGEFPRLLARALARRGRRVFCVAVKGHAEPEVVEHCHDVRWLGIGKLGAAIRYFRRHGVREATLAGKFHKVVLLRPWFILRNLPDLRTCRVFYRHFLFPLSDNKDDTLLSVVAGEFARDGVEIRPATDLMPELLVKYGKLTRRGPSLLQRKDIEFGWQLAREMGRLDVGQTVAVKGRAVLAVEAIEGTDACIRRAGELCASGGFTVIKVAKPQQDMRFDVPTIGLLTLQSMVASGASVLAIEEGKTIIVNEPEVIEFADRHGLAIVALKKEGACEFVDVAEAA